MGVKVRTRSQMQRVARQVRRKSIENLGHAGASIRLVAGRSIRKRKGASPEGQPPHTHTQRLPRAIKYAVERRKSRVVIGPDAESFGTAAKAHEHGGTYRKEHYEPRPFMGPALERTKDRLPSLWAGSVR